MPAPLSDSMDAFLDARLGADNVAHQGETYPLDGKTIKWSSLRPAGTFPRPGGGARTLDVGDPSPSPSPSPEPSASPDAMLTLIEQVAVDERGTRIATSNGYFALCVVVAFLVVLVFQNALRRGR